MEGSWKRGVPESSRSSTDGYDPSSFEPTKSTDESTASTTYKRTYECVFCERGFTNAQALGGHMNIHRKDRAKTGKNANSKQNEVVSSNLFNPNYSSNEPPKHYPVFLGSESSSGSYFVGANHNSSCESYSNLFHEIPVCSTNCLTRNNCGVSCMDLGLQVGPSSVEDHHVRVSDEDMSDEIDLELRLGHGL